MVQRNSGDGETIVRLIWGKEDNVDPRTPGRTKRNPDIVMGDLDIISTPSGAELGVPG